MFGFRVILVHSLCILLQVCIMICESADAPHSFSVPLVSKTKTSPAHNNNGKVKGDSRIPRRYRYQRDQYSTSSAYSLPKNINYGLLAGHGWNPRQMSSFAATNLLQQQSHGVPTEYAFSGAEEDSAAAAGSHGGWGWESGNEGKGIGCNSALGLLGVLGLASYLQNVLDQMNDNTNNNGGTTGGGGVVIGPGTGGNLMIPGGIGGNGRKKRSALRYAENPSLDEDLPQFQTQTAIINKYLLRLNEIRAGNVPLQCSSYPICMLSQITNQGMGNGADEPLRKMLSTIIRQLLEPRINASWNQKGKVDNLVEIAIKVGSKNGKCDKIFWDC